MIWVSVIPAASRAVHGLDREALRGAPAFEVLYPGITAFLNERVVIGHTIGFDIAMLTKEAERIGQRFVQPLALDIRLLAQLAEPGLPSYSLEALGAWLAARGVPAVLVRPDRYVFGSGDPAALIAAWRAPFERRVVA